VSGILERRYDFVRGPHFGVSFHWNTIFIDEDEPFDVYQYTSLEGACSMLGGEQLWATSVRVQNDPRELIYGMDLLDERWLQVQHEDDFYWCIPQVTALIASLRQAFTVQEECYIACASTAPRSLSLFRLYGSVRLKIAASMPLDIIDLEAHQDNKMGYAGGLVWPWQRVRYSERDSTALADMMLTQLAEMAMALYVYPTEDRFEAAQLLPDISDINRLYHFNRARSYYANVVCFVKAVDWAEEQEVRLLARIPTGDKARRKRTVSGRPAGYVALRPDVEIAPGLDRIYTQALVGPSRVDFTTSSEALKIAARSAGHVLQVEDAQIAMRLDPEM
jgi:hypothetical protein